MIITWFPINNPLVFKWYTHWFMSYFLWNLLWFVVGGASLDFVRCVSYLRHLTVGQPIASLIRPHPITTFYRRAPPWEYSSWLHHLVQSFVFGFRVAPSTCSDGATPFLFVALYKPSDCLIKSVVIRLCTPSITTIHLFTTIGERASLEKKPTRPTTKVVSVNFKLSKFGWRLNRQLIFPIQR